MSFLSSIAIFNDGSYNHGYANGSDAASDQGGSTDSGDFGGGEF